MVEYVQNVVIAIAYTALFSALSGYFIWTVWDVIFEIAPFADTYIIKNPSIWQCFKLSFLIGIALTHLSQTKSK